MRTTAFAIAFVWSVAAAAAKAPTADFVAAMLPAAFGPPEAAPTATAARVRRRLPEGMSVVDADTLVVAAPGSVAAATKAAERIAMLDAKLRRRVFPELEPRPIVVVLANDDAALRRIAEPLYPAITGRVLPAGGFYHPIDRVMIVETADGDGPLLRELTRAHVRNDIPGAPHWFGQALTSLYESAEQREDRLVPLLDRRMDDIPADEDLSYDVFAGICDCAQASAGQVALMRLLLVFLDSRDQLPDLMTSVAALGKYSTLLQVLDHMGFDGPAWQAFAERSVRDYAR